MSSLRLLLLLVVVDVVQCKSLVLRILATIRHCSYMDAKKYLFCSVPYPSLAVTVLLLLLLLLPPRLFILGVEVGGGGGGGTMAAVADNDDDDDRLGERSEISNPIPPPGDSVTLGELLYFTPPSPAPPPPPPPALPPPPLGEDNMSCPAPGVIGAGLRGGMVVVACEANTVIDILHDTDRRCNSITHRYASL